MQIPVIEISSYSPVLQSTANHPDSQSGSYSESHTVQLAGSLSALEIEILAAFWNHHPQPLRLSQIYLAVRAKSDDPLQPFVDCLARLVESDLVHHTREPLFHYLLNKKGTFLALYLAIAGLNQKFPVAAVEGNSADSNTMSSIQAVSSGFPTHSLLPAITPILADSDTSFGLPRNAWDNLRPSIVKPACDVEIDHCSFGCGRMATSHCECGNAVCASHSYSAEGHHDPGGVCSTCYDEIAAESSGIQQYGEA